MFSFGSLVIPVLSFFLQSYPRFFNKFFGVDVWTRLLESTHVRQNNHQIPHHKLSGQFIIEGYFDYPPLFPWLMSHFSKEDLLKLQGFVAPFFDSLQVFLVYWVAMFLTGNFWLAILAQVMYALTPMIALENSYLTPRSFGYLNFSLATLPLLFFIHFGNPIFWHLGLIFSTLVFLTHRFATQSFLFVSIFFTFFLDTTVFIKAFLLGFALAMFFTKGYYLRVLKGHLSNIYFWVLNLDYRFAHQVRGILKKDTKTDWVGQVYNFLSVFSPVAVFGLNPWALSGFLALAAHWLGIIDLAPVAISLAAWILFFYFFGVVVLKVKHLMPIGEGQRYMEMATVPSSILSAFLVFEILKGPYTLITVLGLGLFLLANLGLILFVQFKGVIADKNRSITEDIKSVFDYINRQKKPLRIICVPHQNTTLLIYHTKAQVFVNADNPGLLKIQEVYPILKKPLKELAKKYKLSHALVRTSFASLRELNLKKKDVVFEEGDIRLVKI